MNWKFWQKKPTLLPPSEENSFLFPQEINEESNDFFEAFGISEKRKNELFAAGLLAYSSTTNLCSAISKAARDAKVTHANELSAISYVVAKHHITLQNPASGLLGLLGGKPNA